MIGGRHVKVLIAGGVGYVGSTIASACLPACLPACRGG